MEEIHFLPEYVSELYDKEIIAFGTGKVGRLAIPYLVRDPRINLIGVTNSRVTEDSGKEFSDTQLPLRPLSVWRDQHPDAAILVTILDKDYKDEAKDICAAVGFNDIVFLSYQFFCALSYAYVNNTTHNLDVLYQLCKPFLATTNNPAFEAACLANEIRDLHTATFSEFKNCNRGRDVVIVACGPTMNYYTQIPGAQHVGVNTAYRREDIVLDYLFITDYVEESTSCFSEMEKFDFVKFFAQIPSGILRDEMLIPEDVLEKNNARRYIHSEQNDEIHRDIQYYPLMFFTSTVFPAIHFAMYTRPKRIFLVGCDCAGIEHFDGRVGLAEEDIPIWISGYRKIKKFVERNYSDLEIISINPVGLKGMFRDMYTESYLEAHPEINRSECEILD